MMIALRGCHSCGGLCCCAFYSQAQKSCAIRILGARAARLHVRKMRAVPIINRFAPGYSYSAGLHICKRLPKGS